MPSGLKESKKVFSPEEIAYLQGLRREGMTFAQIADLYRGATKDQVQKLLAKAGTPKPVRMKKIKPKKEPPPPHPLVGFTREDFDGVVGEATGDGLFVVTSAMPVSKLSETELFDDLKVGRNVNRPFFASLQRFCQEMDADLVILPLRAHEKPLNGQPSHYDPFLQAHLESMCSEFVFNSNLKAVDAYVLPQQAKPLTGLTRLGGRSRTSLIVAHPKQDMRFIATGNDSHPRMIHCTGTVTDGQYLKNRVGRLAADQHTLGALIVLVKGEKFFVWQVQADDDGAFCFSGYRFSGDLVEPVEAAAIKVGDLHPGFEDRKVLEQWFDVFRRFQPREVYLEDWFDGLSVSHHLAARPLLQAERPAPFRTLGEELDHARSLLQEVDRHVPGALYLTASNHPEHVDRWLEEGRWQKDVPNFWLGWEMIGDRKKGLPVLRRHLDPHNEYQWLTTETDRWVENVQMAVHGHTGINGVKGTPRQFAEHLGDGVGAHTHTPGIDGPWWTTGHSTMKRHGYNRGPSTWVPAVVTVWPGGGKQLVLCVEGDTGLGDLPVPASLTIKGRKDSVPPLKKRREGSPK